LTAASADLEPASAGAFGDLMVHSGPAR